MMKLYTFDHKLIHFFRDITVPFARLALFAIFFWFGILKILGLSPAGPMVHQLFDQTITFMPFSLFYILFALFECLIGILFIVRGAERVVFPLLLFHMITTTMPLLILPDITWQSAFVPTLEGQYIIKNLVIIATAIGLVAHLHPLPKKVRV